MKFDDYEISYPTGYVEPLSWAKFKQMWISGQGNSLTLEFGDMQGAPRMQFHDWLQGSGILLVKFRKISTSWNFNLEISNP